MLRPYTVPRRLRTSAVVFRHGVPISRQPRVLPHARARVPPHRARRRLLARRRARQAVPGCRGGRLRRQLGAFEPGDRRGAGATGAPVRLSVRDGLHARADRGTGGGARGHASRGPRQALLPLFRVGSRRSGAEAGAAVLGGAGLPRKHTIIALAPAYHGNTLLALSASAREHYRAFYREWLVDVHRIPAPYPYRCPCRGLDGGCPICTGDALEDALARVGAEHVAAFIAEPVGGSSTGASAPRPEYFKRIREICDRHQVLFVADEILVGAGRTGTWWAMEQYGAVPDILVMGKGISGGYVPLSAIAAPERIIDVMANGSGSFMHAQTYSHHPVACAAGLAAVRYLKEHRLVERCAEMGKELQRRLAPLGRLPHVGDVRGRGLLAGVEFVEDKETRAPLPRTAKFAEMFVEAAQGEGLVLWPNVGHADGTNGDLVMVAPPFIITERELDALVERFTAALEATVRAVVSRQSTLEPP